MSGPRPSAANAAAGYTAVIADSDSLFGHVASCSVVCPRYSSLFLMKFRSLFQLFDAGTSWDSALSDHPNLCTIAFRGVSTAIASPTTNIAATGSASASARSGTPGSNSAAAANSSSR